MSETQRLKRIVTLLLHRLGGHVILVRADFQATEGKWVEVTGRFGNAITLEIRGD